MKRIEMIINDDGSLHVGMEEGKTFPQPANTVTVRNLKTAIAMLKDWAEADGEAFNAGFSGDKEKLSKDEKPLAKSA